MNRGIFLLVILIVFSCKNIQNINNSSKTIIITSDQVKETVSFLASDEILGRITGSEGIDKSATFIENQFKSFGIKPYFETYRDNFKANDMEAFNVVGFLEGNDPELKKEIVILGAHYDHIGQGQGITKHGGRLTENDSIANGANDNATGTSAVIALANYFAAKKNNKRSIMFALFSAEEFGLLGSKHLAEKLKAENANLYTLLNFEMIGVPLIDKDYVAFLTGYELSNMAEKINEAAKMNLVGASEISKKYQLFKRSDNYSFYEQFKLPCQSVSTCDMENFEYYHHTEDEMEKMNYEHMASFINNIIPAIEAMSNTPTKEIKMYEQ
jgi:Zn-dependent M28 family amino/carboxypeptidase